MPRDQEPLLSEPAAIWARRCLPAWMFWPLREAVVGFQQQWAVWRHPAWRKNVARLSGFRDQHRGERCVIIGNGPSLNHTPLERLRDVPTFGLNRIYLKFDEIGFATTYLLCINKLVLEQFGSDITNSQVPHFLSWHAREHFAPGVDTYLLWPKPSGRAFWFSRDPRLGLCEGYTVTFAAMQLAYFMGFTEVVLVGVDHSFATKGQSNQTVVSKGDDPNHFSADYFGKDVKWQLPDLDGSEIAYRIAKREFEIDRRRVVDATIGGELQVFEKVPFDDLFPAE